ncbi:MAG TPA: biotin/lipoyl-containing protein, partial [Sphingomicrobium sp.]|nr:biotin/lipoyl-containing protein [Sphingomicrobium sp.]
TKREGLSSFGDDRVFIEKFIEDPRHIEIQVLGDQHGNILYLGERECSIQRRHQKVIEEAPSPFVSPAMRKAMGEQAVALARAVGYYSAGTVELIVSGKDPTGKSFYFLEMNTRLQVEHPVTEEVTGLDLVEQMIRVAAGEKLKIKQEDVKLNGWSIEARVYAEDPYRGFLPSTGRLTTYRPPATTRHPRESGDPAKQENLGSRFRGNDEIRIRVDDGVTEGGEVSMFYDPMIAKLISWAPTREEAIEAQVVALDAFQVEGLSDNVDFLSALLQHPRFRAGNLTTGFIAEEYPEGFTGAPADEQLMTDLAALAAIVELTYETRAALIDGQLGDPCFPEAVQVVRIGPSAALARDFTVAIAPYEGGNLAIVDGGEAIDVVGDWSPGNKLLVADMDSRKRVVQVAKKGRGWTLTTRGAAHRVIVAPRHIAELSKHMIEKVPPDMSRFLIAPMPGLLTRLEVKAGDTVEAGQPVAVVEAMKMENILRAEKSATVKATPAKAGDSLAVDQVIVEFE